MKRKSVLAIGVVTAVALGYLVIRDPVGAAGTVQDGWELTTGALGTVAESFSTFLRHLFQG